MRIQPIALNDDNYGYLIEAQNTANAIFVDISNQPDQIIDILRKKQLELKYVLTTHRHWDHQGGNNAIRNAFPNVHILGSDIDGIEGCTRYVKDNETFEMDGINIKCLFTPYHTMGHMSYFMEDGDTRACFTGDALFVGGCGKFFEGTAEDCYSSLYQILAKLPLDTSIYCGHEYTLNNYRFAISVDGENKKLLAANERAIQLRQQGLPTVPSTIGDELATNPFLRVHTKAIKASIAASFADQDMNDTVSLLGRLREMKNSFK